MRHKLIFGVQALLWTPNPEANTAHVATVGIPLQRGGAVKLLGSAIADVRDLDKVVELLQSRLDLRV